MFDRWFADLLNRDPNAHAFYNLARECMRTAWDAALATKALPAGVERDAEFEVWEGEGDSTTMAAGCSGPRADAWREAKHYAFQYAQDGPVRICEITRRWVSPDEVFATSSAEPPR